MQCNVVQLIEGLRDHRALLRPVDQPRAEETVHVGIGIERRDERVQVVADAVDRTGFGCELKIAVA